MKPSLPSQLPQAVEAIVRGYHPERVILFGSHARGGANPPHSDVDLLVVKRGAASNRKESARIRALIRRWVGPLSFTILPMDPERLQERVRRDDAFIRTILAEGVELYAVHG